MGELLKNLAGTAEGKTLALVLALLSAMAHATFGAINKGGVDPYLNRGAINISYSLMAMPFALLILPWPSQELFQILVITFFIHVLYEWLQTVSFYNGAFTVVYPIARGSGPMITALAALIVFKEQLSSIQWSGLIILSGSIFLLGFHNYKVAAKSGQDISGLRTAVTAALFTGVMIAVYTTVDAYGIRLADNPFTFLAWFLMMGGFGFPVIAYRHWRKTKVNLPVKDLALRGITGAVIGSLSFGFVMLATLLGSVSEAAAFRETSIVFATIIGIVIFKEKISAQAIMLIGMIVLGAILIKIG